MTANAARTITRTFGATYSPCGRYRYSLWRAWDTSKQTILWVMLNPSTADHLGNNDPTIERCERRSTAWRFGRMEVVNLFALRSPDPRALRAAPDPVGPDNDRHIAEVAARADLILCGWGAHGSLSRRSRAVMAHLEHHALFSLGLTRSGEPAHPLYLPYRRQPVLWIPATVRCQNGPHPRIKSAAGSPIAQGDGPLPLPQAGEGFKGPRPLAGEGGARRSEATVGR